MIFNPPSEAHTSTAKTQSATVLEALVFNIKMNYFGIPVNQIESIQPFPEDAPVEATERIDRALGFTEECFYLFPSRIFFKSDLQSAYSSRSMLIDGIVGIFEVKLNHLLLLPKTIQFRLSGSLIWAAALIEEQGLKDLVLLLNFDQLPSSP